MGSRTHHPPGTFSWVDLATDDLEGAKAFYGGLLGWRFEDVPVTNGTYSMAHLGDHVVGAIYASQQPPPHWNNYVTVESADLAAQRAQEVGGAVVMEPFDVMDVGRMAVIQDPTGGHLCVWEPRGSIGATIVNVPGALCWNELGTPDHDAAGRFYSDLFGWTLQRSTETASPLPYSMILNGDRMNGGIRQQDPESEGEIPAFWLPYFAVADLDDALGRATAAGAVVRVPRVDMASGSIAVLQDPQHAPFALFAGTLED